MTNNDWLWMSCDWQQLSCDSVDDHVPRPPCLRESLAMDLLQKPHMTKVCLGGLKLGSSFFLWPSNNALWRKQGEHRGRDGGRKGGREEGREEGGKEEVFWELQLHWQMCFVLCSSLVPRSLWTRLLCSMVDNSTLPLVTSIHTHRRGDGRGEEMEGRVPKGDIILSRRHFKRDWKSCPRLCNSTPPTHCVHV